MTTKEQATRAGEKLLKKLKGKNWKADVWENLGWHHAATKTVGPARLTVYPDYCGEKEYTALLGYSTEYGGHGGDMLYHGEKLVFSSKDPNKVVEYYIKKAKMVAKDRLEFAAATEKMNK